MNYLTLAVTRDSYLPVCVYLVIFLQWETLRNRRNVREEQEQRANLRRDYREVNSPHLIHGGRTSMLRAHFAIETPWPTGYSAIGDHSTLSP